MKYLISVMFLFIASEITYASTEQWGTFGTSNSKITLASIMSKDTRTVIAIKFEKSSNCGGRLSIMTPMPATATETTTLKFDGRVIMIKLYIDTDPNSIPDWVSGDVYALTKKGDDMVESMMVMDNATIKKLMNGSNLIASITVNNALAPLNIYSLQNANNAITEAYEMCNTH